MILSGSPKLIVLYVYFIWSSSLYSFPSSVHVDEQKKKERNECFDCE